MKKQAWQITANIILSGDGWAFAETKEEAEKIYRAFLMDQVNGLSVAGIDILESFSRKSRHFDNDIPEELGERGDELDFDKEPCITYQLLS